MDYLPLLFASNVLLALATWATGSYSTTPAASSTYITTSASVSTVATTVSSAASSTAFSTATSTIGSIFSTAFEVECDLSQCNNRLLKYYQELDCTPVTPEGACCPTSFDCTNLTSRDASKCYYRGRAYSDRERVNKADVSNPCIVVCDCRSDYGVAAFTCVSSECPAVFGPPLQHGCVRLYTPNKCCSKGTYCEDERRQDVEKPFQCEYGGKTYVEGQYIYSDDAHCKSCICQQGFNGTLDGPWCRELSCDVDLHNGRRIRAGCAPIYYGSEVCCPVDWRCPASSDSVIPVPSNSSVDEKCHFGSLTLNVGDSLSPSDNPCVTCTCSTPPHVSCQQTPHDKCSRPVQAPSPSPAPSQPAPSARTNAK